VVPDAIYRSVTIALRPGDLVVLYTDGVTDAMDENNQPFGEVRLQRALAGARGGAAEAGEAIIAAVNDFARGPTQFDDITIVCFGRVAE
jgi:phosphoserine phosphatase RsbU/P